MAKKRKSFVEFAKALTKPRRETWWDRLPLEVKKDLLEMRDLFIRDQLAIDNKQGLAKAIMKDKEFAGLGLSKDILIGFLGDHGQKYTAG